MLFISFPYQYLCSVRVANSTKALRIVRSNKAACKCFFVTLDIFITVNGGSNFTDAVEGTSFKREL